MDSHDRFAFRVDEVVVARILHLIATAPNRRDTPIAGDLVGDYDFWFDGAAGRIVTGWNAYEFRDGARATVDTIPILSVVMEFPNGSRVSVKQEDKGIGRNSHA